MGPIEIVFLVMIAIFGAIGVVRGFGRELGVTTLLLIALLLLEFLDEQYPTQLGNVLGRLVSAGAVTQSSIKAGIYCAFLILIVFISYEGETLSFPTKVQSQAYGATFGLINGYLFAGSLWYYLHQASWLGWEGIQTNFSEFYLLAVKILPPAVFQWKHLIVLVALMLILRVWK
jgi:hypothetical protein